MEELVFVTSVSKLDVFSQRLLASPCLQSGQGRLVAHFNATSAAQAFNATLQGLDTRGSDQWLVWVHQDVVLPQGWDQRFLEALRGAQAQFPDLAVVGVHGVAGAGANARRAGHVLDRGHLLKEASALPCLVDSVDELLFAVRVGSGLQLDPALGYDFYGSDIVQCAREAGLQSAVVDAYCEHWSDTPMGGAMPARVVQRILSSASVFEHKWAHRLPITTPCFDIAAPGDVQSFVDTHITQTP
ncbi:MAG: hypothetical protein CFE41_01335 [Burkholderiales bacterium PBB2]|nr:MAG: hypothetical protein CFE41_01335 [Burkholderiales bacterium PBB2]